MRYCFLVASASLLTGCANLPSNAPVEPAATVAEQSAEPEEQIIGPIERKNLQDDLNKLSPEDRVRAIALLDQGVEAYCVLVPDYSQHFQMSGNQRPPVQIRVGRLIFAKDSKFVAEFEVP